MISIEEVLFCSRNLFVSATKIFAHLSFGNPNIPELIAGMEIERYLSCDASSNELLIAFVNLCSSFPSPILGPTA